MQNLMALWKNRRERTRTLILMYSFFLSFSGSEQEDFGVCFLHLLLFVGTCPVLPCRVDWAVALIVLLLGISASPAPLALFSFAWVGAWVRACVFVTALLARFSACVE